MSFFLLFQCKTIDGLIKSRALTTSVTLIAVSVLSGILDIFQPLRLRFLQFMAQKQKTNLSFPFVLSSYSVTSLFMTLCLLLPVTLRSSMRFCSVNVQTPCWWISSRGPRMQCESWITCSTVKWRRSSFRRPTTDPQQKSRMETRCVNVWMLESNSTGARIWFVWSCWSTKYTCHFHGIPLCIESNQACIGLYACLSVSRCLLCLFFFLLFPLWLFLSTFLSLSLCSVSRSWSRAEVGRERWTVLAVISPSPACPSAPAPRAALSTAWTKRPRTAAASWTWWRETTQSCQTAQSYTSNRWVKWHRHTRT